MDISGSTGETTIEQSRIAARRPPPLKIPVRMPTMEIPEDMVEWHGILLPAHECESPVTPSHWTIRIEEPIIKHYCDLVISALSMIRRKSNSRLTWTDTEATEILPNLYLGSYRDVCKLDHTARVSVMDDYSLFHIIVDNEKQNRADKLEINAKDDGDTNIMSHFAEIRDFLDKQPADGIKIIHCVAGMNRSATLAVAYYIYKTKCSLFYALQHMVTLRPIILRNENFLKQLVVWAYDNDYLNSY